MTLDEFKSADAATFSLPLQALWHDAKGDWDEAHTLAQQAQSPDGDWVHAYLHRKEGDAGNAAYWYSRAKRKVAQSSLADEWAQIVKELLSRPGR